MAGLNRATLIGNLGKDPDVRRMANGNSVVTFSVATSESWRDKQTGDTKEKIEWHNVVIFNEHIGKIAEDYLRKGNKVYIEGAIRTRKYEKDGIDRYTTEIVLANFDGKLVLLTPKGEGGGSSGGRNQDRSEEDYGRTSTRETASKEEMAASKPSYDPDDPIPF